MDTSTADMALRQARHLTEASVIRTYLDNGNVTFTEIIQAISYFKDGEGALFEKPCSAENWADLLAKFSVRTADPF